MSRVIFPPKPSSETRDLVFDYTSRLRPGETFACSTFQFNDVDARLSILYIPSLNEIWIGNDIANRAITRRTPTTGAVIGYIAASAGDATAGPMHLSADQQFVFVPGTNGDYMKFDVASKTYVGPITTTDFPNIAIPGSSIYFWDVGFNSTFTLTTGHFYRFDYATGTQTAYTTSLNDPDLMTLDTATGNIWCLREASATNFDFILSKFDTTSHTITASYTLGLKVHQLGYNATRNSIMLACEDGGGTVREFSLNTLALTASSFPAAQINSNCEVAMVDDPANGNFYVAVQRNPDPSNHMFIYGIKGSNFTQFSQIDFPSQFGVSQLSIFPSGVLVSDGGSCYSWMLATAPQGVDCSISPVRVEVYSGIDAAPNDMLNGSATLKTPKVSQSITGGIEGTVYDVICSVVTSLGRKLTLSGFLAIPKDLL